MDSVKLHAGAQGVLALLWGYHFSSAPAIYNDAWALLAYCIPGRLKSIELSGLLYFMSQHLRKYPGQQPSQDSS